MTLHPGDLIDEKYRIVRLIGEGGMGAVYEGENTRIHRRVAIKVLHAEVAQMADVVARFEREAQAAGRIGSEHIVEVLDLGTLANGDRYIVMEFMDGESLSQRIRSRQKLPPREAYVIIHQTLEALAAAHTAGIVHRDLKPDNIFLVRSKKGAADFVKLLDFGISKFSGTAATLSLTRTGAVMGTPYYMAPEQAKGSREFDHRVDLYSLGIVLYEALTGQVPFQAETFNQLLFKIVLEEPRPIEELSPELDAKLVGIVKKGMAREPAHRYKTAAEFQAALEDWASDPSAVAPVVPPPKTAEAAPTAHTASALAMTPGNWTGQATTAADAPTKTRSKGPLFLAGGVALLAVAAGAAFMLGSKKESSDAGLADTGAVAPSATPAAASPAPAAEPSLPPASDAPAPTASALPPAIVPDTSPSAVASAAPVAGAVKAAAAAPARRAAPAAAPEKRKDAPAGAITGGRRFRTSL